MELERWLRVCITLAEDLSWGPAPTWWLTTTYNFRSRALIWPSWASDVPCKWCRQNPCIHTRTKYFINQLRTTRKCVYFIFDGHYYGIQRFTSWWNKNYQIICLFFLPSLQISESHSCGKTLITSVIKNVRMVPFVVGSVSFSAQDPSLWFLRTHSFGTERWCCRLAVSAVLVNGCFPIWGLHQFPDS